MLGKLLKQDFRATARVILPLYLAVLALAVFSNLGTRLAERYEDIAIIQFLEGLLLFLFFIGLFVVLALTFVFMIVRFYRSFMTDEAYLMFTLPVSTAQLISSKLIVTVVWFIGAALVDAVACVLFVLDSKLVETFWPLLQEQLLYTALPVSNGQVIALGLEVVAVALLSAVCFCLMIYAAMAVGQSFRNHKGLLSVVFAYVFWNVVQIVSMGAMVGTASGMNGSSVAMTGIEGVQVLFGYGIGVTLLLSIAFYFLTHVMLKRRLNLQ